MPKRKRNKEKEDEEAKVATVLYERWDSDMVLSINELVLDPQTESLVSVIASEMTPSLLNPAPRARRAVTYTSREFEEGRVYGHGLQGVSGWIRRLCSYQYYHDLDIVNAAPTLLYQVLERTMGICPKLIKAYALDRPGMFRRLREEEPQLVNVPDGVLKGIFLTCLHGGNHTNHFPEIGLSQDHEPIALLAKWEKTITKVMKKLMTHDGYKKMAKQIKKMEDKKNKIGTFTSWVWQKEENCIILALKDYLRQREGLVPGVLVFDGIMAERKEPYPALLEEAVLRRCEAFIEKELGLVVKFIEKPLTPKLDDWNRYWGEKALQKIKTDERKQLYLLAREGQLNNYKRQTGWLMKPHTTIPGVFYRTEEDTEFINRVLKSYHLYRGASVTRLSEWFNSADHPKFELLTPGKMNTSAISFTNGFLDLNTLIFTPWEEVEMPPLTDHFFEQTLDLSNAMDAPTPLWDSLLEKQLGNRSKCYLCGKLAVFARGKTLLCGGVAPRLMELEPAPLSMCDMLEVLIGRLFYPIGKHDNWQVMPFMMGDANTGKGTVCDLVKRMFSPGSVGVITATQEQQFGLESLCQKRLIMIPDLPKKFGKIINQSDFQSMVTGEGVSVARKNKTAISDQDWTVPMLGAGNYLPDYNDNSGSISRRLVVFLFSVLITARNTALKDTIIRDELVTIMIRCIVRYRTTCERWGGADFWVKIAPASLREVQSEVKEETNYLANFLANGDDYYQVLYVKGTVTPMDQLEKAFSNHMRIKHKQDKAKIGDDKHPIKAAGYTIERVNLCKICHQKSSKDVCGDHYSSNNRFRKWVIHNMRITSLRDA